MSGVSREERVPSGLVGEEGFLPRSAGREICCFGVRSARSGGSGQGGDCRRHSAGSGENTGRKRHSLQQFFADVVTLVFAGVFGKNGHFLVVFWWYKRG
jgi:hypothetical protein